MYQTFDGLLSLYGPKRLAEATPQVPGESLQSYWDEKLRAASSVVNMNVRRAGYVTPIDTTSLAVEEKLDMDALLAYMTGVLALELGAPALVAGSKGVEGAASKVRTILRDVVSGKARLPFALTRAVVANVLGPEQSERRWTYAPMLDDALYARLRSNYGCGGYGY